MKSSSKKVRFAEKIVAESPAVKSRPLELKHVIRIGSFNIDLPSCSSAHDVNPNFSGTLKKDTTYEDDFDSTDVNSSAQYQDPEFCSVKKSSDNYATQNTRSSFVLNEVINHARRIGSCTRCFSNSHDRVNCSSMLRCAACFNYGHRFKYCTTLSKPKILWRPKKSMQFGRQPAQAGKATQESSTETEGRRSTVLPLQMLLQNSPRQFHCHLKETTAHLHRRSVITKRRTTWPTSQLTPTLLSQKAWRLKTGQGLLVAESSSPAIHLVVMRSMLL